MAFKGSGSGGDHKQELNPADVEALQSVTKKQNELSGSFIQITKVAQIDLTQEDARHRLIKQVSELAQCVTNMRTFYQKLAPVIERVNTETNHDSPEIEKSTGAIKNLGVVQGLAAYLSSATVEWLRKYNISTLTGWLKSFLPDTLTPFQTFADDFIKFISDFEKRTSEIKGLNSDITYILKQIHTPPSTPNVSVLVDKLKSSRVKTVECKKFFQESISGFKQQLDQWRNQKQFGAADEGKEKFVKWFNEDRSILIPTMTALRDMHSAVIPMVPTLKDFRNEFLGEFRHGKVSTEFADINDLFEKIPNSSEFEKQFDIKDISRSKWLGTTFTDYGREVSSITENYKKFYINLSSSHTQLSSIQGDFNKGLKRLDFKENSLQEHIKHFRKCLDMFTQLQNTFPTTEKSLINGGINAIKIEDFESHKNKVVDFAKKSLDQIKVFIEKCKNFCKKMLEKYYVYKTILGAALEFNKPL